MELGSSINRASVVLLDCLKLLSFFRVSWHSCANPQGYAIAQFHPPQVERSG